MTEEQRKLCRSLIIFPPRGSRKISKEEFLQQFPSAVENGKLAISMLTQAYDARSAEDLQCALIVGFTFGFALGHEDLLCRLIDLDWHHNHEDVVEALDRLRTPDAVEALFRATQWIPKSLEYDDSRAMAVKAIWALGKLPSIEAKTKLEILAASDNAILRKAAAQQLELRHQGS